MPSLDPAVAAVRRAVRGALAGLVVEAAGRGAGPVGDGTADGNRVAGGSRAELGSTGRTTSGAACGVAAELAHAAQRTADQPTPPATVVVALSGGADSLSLASATAFEAGRLGLRAVSATVDHGLQDGSAQIAERAATTASGLGIEARTVRVEVAPGAGPEAAAREARYAALRRVAHEEGAAAVLLGHTRDDQAETVLLGLARGSGAGSLAGMPAERRDEDGLRWMRPLLALSREATRACCTACGLEPWADPHNDDPRYLRVRARHRVLPVLEAELGPGIAEALARTAEQAREDQDAFAAMIDETIEDIVEPAEAGIAVSAPALAANPPAIRHRVIRHVVASEFGESLTRVQTLEVARLVTDWSGQGPIDLPGCRAAREAGRIVFTRRGRGGR